MKFGMGIRIVILEAKPGGQTSLAQLISEAKPSGKRNFNNITCVF